LVGCVNERDPTILILCWVCQPNLYTNLKILKGEFIIYQIINNDCLDVFRGKSINHKIALTFLDPPFNQNKEYAYHNDNMSEEHYWTMMTDVCISVRRLGRGTKPNKSNI